MSPRWSPPCCSHRTATSGSGYELIGPAALNLDELAEQYSRALGRTITAVHLSYDEWFDHLTRAGLSAHVQQHIATMARLHRNDRYNRSTTDVAQITGRAARTVEDYVSERRDLFDGHHDDKPSCASRPRHALSGSTFHPSNSASRRRLGSYPHPVVAADYQARLTEWDAGMTWPPLPTSMSSHERTPKPDTSRCSAVCLR